MNIHAVEQSLPEHVAHSMPPSISPHFLPGAPVFRCDFPLTTVARGAGDCLNYPLIYMRRWGGINRRVAAHVWARVPSGNVSLKCPGLSSVPSCLPSLMNHNVNTLPIFCGHTSRVRAYISRGPVPRHRSVYSGATVSSGGRGGSSVLLSGRNSLR